MKLVKGSASDSYIVAGSSLLNLFLLYYRNIFLQYSALIILLLQLKVNSRMKLVRGSATDSYIVAGSSLLNLSCYITAIFSYNTAR
ncbi:MAG: hypothetical protein PHW35_09205 [Lentimicrobiaceae bacterium]|jgi:hypothetical protein|nr:hypothetical protein [Lentimicrobiaceae bacterium]MDD4598132.1 hypothetical protein [Lentimicrobiaceae bacterium]MDY0026556.1 hypothetical protein [Lentimicrobium sp.]